MDSANRVARSPDDTRSGGSQRVLAVVTAGNFSQLGVRLLIGAVIPFVLLDFAATTTVVGIALTGLWATYAVFQFPSGVLADRYSERPLILGGIGGAAVGTIAVALAPSILLFGIATVLLGAGAGLYFAPASSLLSRLFDNQGGALSVLTAGGAVAGVVYPIAGAFVAEAVGWRVAVGLGALVALPAFAAGVVFLPRTPPTNPSRTLKTAVEPARLLGLLRRPALAYTTTLAVCTGFTFQAVTSFFTTFLVEYRGLDATSAGVVFGVVFALSAITQPLAGRASDRFTRDGAIAGSVTLTASGFVVLLWVPGLVGLSMGTLLLGSGFSWPGTIQARIMDQLDDRERGYGFGSIRSTYMLLAASGSVIVGTLAAVGGWPLAYGLVIGLLASCLVLLGANWVFELDV